MYRLEMVDERGRTVNFSLNKEGTLSLGRHGDNDIILEGKAVSRNHCLLYVKANCVEVQDLDSTNGVFIGGDRIKQRTEITLGDEFTVGNNRLTLREMRQEDATSETFIGMVPTEAIKKDE